MANCRRSGGSLVEPPPRFQPSPLHDWPAFENCAMPVWLDWYQQYRRLPSKRELQRHGHGHLVWAAYAHHGGLQLVHRRLGFNRAEHKHNGRNYRVNWYDPAVLTGWLENHFPQLLAWGIAPPEKHIRRIRFNPHRYALSVGGWKKLMESHGLRPSLAGQREKSVILAIDEALSFREQHRRWPKKRECSARLRRARYQRNRDWDSFVRQDDFHPDALEHLLARWQRHYPRIPADRPDWTRPVHAHINHLLLTIHQRRPFTRLSP